MKISTSIIVFFTIGLISANAGQLQEFRLSAFKEVPDDLMGCGDDCYLSKKDEKIDAMICRTNYAQALIRVNNKSILLNANEHFPHTKNENIYTNAQYILILKKSSLKKTGSEGYEFKGTITIRSGSKILYQQQIVGDGGC